MARLRFTAATLLLFVASPEYIPKEGLASFMESSVDNGIFKLMIQHGVSAPFS